MSTDSPQTTPNVIWKYYLLGFDFFIYFGTTFRSMEGKYLKKKMSDQIDHVAYSSYITLKHITTKNQNP